MKNLKEAVRMLKKQDTSIHSLSHRKQKETESQHFNSYNQRKTTSQEKNLTKKPN